MRVEHVAVTPDPKSVEVKDETVKEVEEAPAVEEVIAEEGRSS